MAYEIENPIKCKTGYKPFWKYQVLNLHKHRIKLVFYIDLFRSDFKKWIEMFCSDWYLTLLMRGGCKVIKVHYSLHIGNILLMYMKLLWMLFHRKIYMYILQWLFILFFLLGNDGLRTACGHLRNHCSRHDSHFKHS